MHATPSAGTVEERWLAAGLRHSPLAAWMTLLPLKQERRACLCDCSTFLKYMVYVASLNIEITGEIA